MRGPPRRAPLRFWGGQMAAADGAASLGRGGSPAQRPVAVTAGRSFGPPGRHLPGRPSRYSWGSPAAPILPTREGGRGGGVRGDTAPPAAAKLLAQPTARSR